MAGAPSPENEDAGPDMRDALLAELEYYLSDKMLPHIKTDKHGLIPLSSLVALSSVRRLCQDEEIIREVIRSSGMIQLSADGAGTFPPHLARPALRMPTATASARRKTDPAGDPRGCAGARVGRKAPVGPVLAPDAAGALDWRQAIRGIDHDVFTRLIESVRSRH